MTPDDLTQDQRDEYEERAAHHEFDAGMNRAKAQYLAWQALGVVE